MSWNDPTSRSDRFPTWPPPDPSTRVSSGLDVAPGQDAPRRRWTIAPLLAALIGFVAAATLAFGLVGRSGSTDGSVAVHPPSTASPTTDAPREASDSVSLSAGVVLVTTVLGLQKAEAAGTGIVLTSGGEVLTNNHVVDGSTQVNVTVALTGQSYAAKVVGTDPSADIAVLQLVKATGLSTAHIGQSSTVKVGDAVVGLGNALGQQRLVAASGAITATDQTVTATDEVGGSAETLQHLIETSAQLQPGDSGGPLFDAAGTVIGIDTIGSTGPGRRSGGRGAADSFAIPIDAAIAAAKLIESGKSSPTITIGTPPLLGISADPAADASSGVPITYVGPGTPAEQIGLQAGDILTKVGDATITSLDELTAALHAHHAGDKVDITWIDATGAHHTVAATLVVGPAN